MSSTITTLEDQVDSIEEFDIPSFSINQGLEVINGQLDAQNIYLRFREFSERNPIESSCITVWFQRKCFGLRTHWDKP